MHRKRFQIFLGIFLITLGLNTAASAGDVSIALTAVVDVSTVEAPSGVFQFTSQTIRITQKDILGRLAEFYTFPDGSRLNYASGVFSIVDADGAHLYSVSTSYLALPSSMPVASGTKSLNAGEMSKIKIFGPVTLEMAIDSENYFSLPGVWTQQISGEFVPGPRTTLYKTIAMGGTGMIDGKSCVVAGKLKAKELFIL